MNEPITTAGPAGGAGNVSRISQAVIRIAGNSQDGIQAIGGFLARLAGRSEQEVMMFMTIPSTISGGPSIFQVRISSGEVLSAGDDADLLLAFYQHSYEEHIGSLAKGGIVLSRHADYVEAQGRNYGERDSPTHVGIAISSLTVEAIRRYGSRTRERTFFPGPLAKMFGLNVPKLETQRSANVSAAKIPSAWRTRWPLFMPGITIRWRGCSIPSSLPRARRKIAIRW